jgi:hypothetical protein
MIYRDAWKHLSWMTFCWIRGCPERVTREDEVGLCPAHIEELRAYSNVVGPEVRGG